MLLIESYSHYLIAIMCLGMHLYYRCSLQQCTTIPLKASVDKRHSHRPSLLCCLIWLLLLKSSVQVKKKYDPLIILLPLF